MTRYLLEQGHQVISYDISEEYEYPEKNDPRVTVIIGDIRSKEQLNLSMRGSDIVIHAAAALPLYTEEEIFSIDVDGTKNVLLAAQENGIKRVIQISSTAVYGIPTHHPLIEEDELIDVGPYGKAKIDAEKICDECRQEEWLFQLLGQNLLLGQKDWEFLRCFMIGLRMVTVFQCLAVGKIVISF